jgi:hypothetical protein
VPALLFAAGSADNALVLIDDSRTMVEWASPGGAHCQAHCKNGHCGAIVKVTKGAGDRVSLIAKKLTGFDAIDAGAYVVRPRELFDALKQLLTESIYCTLCEALNLMASQGRLRYATVDELDWFGSQTVASLPTPIYSSAVDPAWRQLALEMLRTTSPHLKALPALPTPGPEDAADASAASSSRARALRPTISLRRCGPLRLPTRWSLPLKAVKSISSLRTWRIQTWSDTRVTGRRHCARAKRWTLRLDVSPPPLSLAQAPSL